MMYYNEFGNWIKKFFPYKVQKIAIDAGFTCPNRDGLRGKGGCTFCDNQSFNPSYCHRHRSITEQIEEGKLFFAKKYPDMKYLAYFQAYSNTYASIDTLRERYEEALACEDIVGLIIGTRPDCIDQKILELLARLQQRTFVMVEYGIESANDSTLERIHRGHDFACSQQAVNATHAMGLLTGAHVILGLPGEDAAESLRQASIISALPLDVLKIHQLQIIRGTQLAKQYQAHPFHLYSVDEYIDLVIGYLQRLRPDLVVERFVSQSPPDLLIGPKWGMKNYEFTHRLLNTMKARGVWQGQLA